MTGKQLVQALSRLGCSVDRQSGSHIRLLTISPSQHHITVPAHDPIKVGTLNAILREMGQHAGLECAELLRQLIDD